MQHDNIKTGRGETMAEDKKQQGYAESGQDQQADRWTYFIR